MEKILTPDSYNNLRDNLQVLDNIYTVTGIKQSATAALACTETRAGVDGGLDQLSVDLEDDLPPPILSEMPLGPVQLSGDFARDQGLNVTGDANDERLKWEKALPAAAEEIFKSTIYFSGKDNKLPEHPSWGLGFWRMHMGRNGIKELIERYSANKGLAFTNVSDFVNEQKITPFKILKIQNIQKDLEEPGYDQTPIYVARIAACASIFDDMEPTWRKQLTGKIETVVDSAKIVKFPQKVQDKAA
jgi:hypothetical protein